MLDEYGGLVLVERMQLLPEDDTTILLVLPGAAVPTGPALTSMARLARAMFIGVFNVENGAVSCSLLLPVQGHSCEQCRF